MCLKIMVIEDDAEILYIVYVLLTEEGHKVIHSSDLEIIKEVNTIQPDVILMDELLGNEKGSEACKALKADTATSHIPVVMMSALLGIEKMAAEAGADGFLRKPFHREELSATVRHWQNKS
ncbi:response regulator [Pedobacter westerhofensis]|nr:response regulator [Pedobacter westerhofensis]